MVFAFLCPVEVLGNLVKNFHKSSKSFHRQIVVTTGTKSNHVYRIAFSILNDRAPKTKIVQVFAQLIQEFDPGHQLAKIKQGFAEAAGRLAADSQSGKTPPKKREKAGTVLAVHVRTLKQPYMTTTTPPLGGVRICLKAYSGGARRDVLIERR